jgi:hypothetical protein
MTLMPAQNVVELSAHVLEATDPSALLNSNVEVVRIFVQYSNIPFDFLENLIQQSHAVGTLREMHVYVQSSLRVALVEMSMNARLKRSFTSMIQAWTGSKLTFFFLRPKISVDPASTSFANFVEVPDLLTAIEGIAEATLELSDILARVEEPTVFPQPIIPSYNLGGKSNLVDVDDYL